MNRPIHAVLTRCRFGQPLVVLDSQPFNGLEIFPDDLRRMAQQLTALADVADRQLTEGKHYRAVKVTMGVGAVGVTAPPEKRA